ncbi:hypothetical protein RBU49_00680 [Clostridium sp. MB40-C1]|uniref:hypothetical protein n=1 Tax=Clostridium sp. MB40-C1 TaxID=3070996 RepID=UPI0027DEE7E5|nr:hypothetical protein [Clostridium sp. MB40-C1]WMJ80792.1 hypothetical protein RBU49_00680 [Clostridium sp. MB40-C1]
MDSWKNKTKDLFEKWSTFMKSNRYLWGILIAVSLGIVFYLSYRITLKNILLLYE